jgi:integrase
MSTRKAPAKIRGVYERDPGSGVWWICYKQGSVRKREKVGSRGNAVTLYQQRKTELRAGAKLAPNLRSHGVSFAALAADALSWSGEFHPKDIRTVRSRMSRLLESFGHLSASGVTPQVIDRWLTANEAWSPATKNRYRALLSLVFRQAMRNGRVSTNPARLVAARAENNARVRYLLDREEAALRVAMRGRFDCHVPALDIALNTGMRLSEQFSLTWESVDLKRKVIELDETKNGSSRQIPINSACEAAFKVLGTNPHKRTDRVFRSTRGGDINTPRAWFGSALDAAKIEGLRWHDLRHTFCSRLAMAGVDVRTIAELAGHKTLQMAMRYTHLAPSHTLSAVERLTERG